MRLPLTSRYNLAMLGLLLALWSAIGIEWQRRPARTPRICRLARAISDPMKTAGLHRPIPHLVFHERPLAEVLAQLQSISGATIVARWNSLRALGVVPETAISATVGDVDLGTALHEVLRAAHADLVYAVLNGGTIVVCPPALNVPMSLAVYDLRDLATLSAAPAPPTPTTRPLSAPFAINTPGISIRIEWSPLMSRPESAILSPLLLQHPREKCIAELIAPALVDETLANPDPRFATLCVYAHRMVILGSPENHRRVQEIFRQLRPGGNAVK